MRRAASGVGAWRAPCPEATVTSRRGRSRLDPTPHVIRRRKKIHPPRHFISSCMLVRAALPPLRSRLPPPPPPPWLPSLPPPTPPKIILAARTSGFFFSLNETTRERWGKQTLAGRIPPRGAGAHCPPATRARRSWGGRAGGCVRGAPDRRAVVSLAGAGGWALGRRRRQRAARGLPVIAGAAAAAFKLAGRGQTRRRLVPGVADQVDPGAGRRGRRRRRRRRRRRWTEAQGDRAVPEALLPEAAGSSPRDRRPRLRYGLLAPRLLFDWGNLGVYVCVCVCAIGGSIDFST